MGCYRVTFFNTLLSSDGHPFKALQRMIYVEDQSSTEEAVCEAQRCFETVEHVPDWRLHAARIEIEPGETKPASRGARRACRRR